MIRPRSTLACGVRSRGRSLDLFVPISHNNNHCHVGLWDRNLLSLVRRQCLRSKMHVGPMNLVRVGGHLDLITGPMPLTIRNINDNRDCAIDATELFFSVFENAKQTL